MVEHKAGNVFQNAERLARAIQIGIDGTLKRMRHRDSERRGGCGFHTRDTTFVQNATPATHEDLPRVKHEDTDFNPRSRKRALELGIGRTKWREANEEPAEMRN